jgi:hypothetical protein
MGSLLGRHGYGVPVQGLICGFKLANDGHDTRALQHWLGHKNISNTTI